MNLRFLLIFCCLSSFVLNAQDGDLNMKIVAHVPAPEGGSGIWHFVDRNGVEYAALGSRTALVVYSLEDPSKPIERYRASGVNTTWREVFSYGDYIYGVTDASSDGVIIINMKEAPSKISHKFWTTNVTANNQTGDITTCHTVFIDEKGILSLNGCGAWRGVLFFDLNVNPENPKFLGSETKRYCHDNFVRNDTMYSSDIYEGLLTIWDVKDQQNPKELATINTPFAFTHNAWPSDDAKYVFTTDERENAFVASYDISDLTNIKLLDQWRPKDTEGTGVIPHNTRYLNGYLITAYYTDGVKIIDAHKPDNLIEVGSVDTYTGNQRGFHGCWGVSPYLPSGTIVASDIEGGLFVIQPEYIRACYLEGKVTDSITNEVISNVSVVLKTPRKNEEQTNLKGLYKTGYATAGSYDVEFTHPDYIPQTVSVDLEHGVVTLRDIKLVKRATIIQRVIVKEKGSLQEIEDAHVSIFNPNRKVEGTTNALGESALAVPQDNQQYQIVAGKWGYLHGAKVLDSQNPQGDITILIEKGYQDDFLFDLSWNVKSTASAGLWVRAEPLGSTRNNRPVQTDLDVPNDYGYDCYVTGNSSSDPSGDDVDGGATTLTSPNMDLSTYRQPLLNLEYWFTNGGGNNNPNDSLAFYLINYDQTPTDTILFFQTDVNDTNWRKLEKIKIKDFLQNLTSVSLYVVAGDYDPGHLVEAAIDAFLITEGEIVTNKQTAPSIAFELYPSLFSDESYLRLNDHKADILYCSIFNTSGKLVEQMEIPAQTRIVAIGKKLDAGMYYLQLQSKDGRSGFAKMIKTQN
ncbi:MAG: choice-of-anchor B family protein [Saprospiraceae bacterium]|nr:choice-of-anchor B family protein [Saprospiraceae bacterium]